MVRGEYPVLVLAGETTQCHTVSQKGVPDSDDAVYVLTYSEDSQSLCLSVYAKVPDNSTTADVVTFKSDAGQNYGRQFSGTFRAVPLHRSLTVLTPQYLALLHWRARADRAAFVNAGKSQRVTSPSAQMSFADASISFAELRTEVARIHNLVNRALSALILLAAAVIVFSVSILYRLYRRGAKLCQSYDFVLRFHDFLRRDFADIAREAATSHQERRQHLLGEMRLENTLRRERQETRLRLEALLITEVQDDGRLRIQQALESDDLEQMHSVLQQLQPHVLQKTPEERLHMLLESLKEYCHESEFEQCEREILDVLHREGFRQAREAVINHHDQFRSRFKQQQTEQQILQNEQPTPTLQPHKR
jgi:hypothetical protein